MTERPSDPSTPAVDPDTATLKSIVLLHRFATTDQASAIRYTQEEVKQNPELAGHLVACMAFHALQFLDGWANAAGVDRTELYERYSSRIYRNWQHRQASLADHAGEGS